MDFKSRYRRECLLQGLSPLHIVEAYLTALTLDFKFYRIPVLDWNPIFSTLRSDLTLKKICISIDPADIEFPNPTHKKKLTYLKPLIDSLVVHLSNNHMLTELKLVGLPLNSYIEHLAKGLTKVYSLQCLSFSKSKIGDQGAKMIVEAIKMKPTIVWLDFSSCDLSSHIGEILHGLIHTQTLARENAVWKATLREEIPDFDLMGGLRRITLNDNNLNNASTNLALALQEDRWIKAVDLRKCYLDNNQLDELIKAATMNQSLIFLDVDDNNLNPDHLRKLKEVLEWNALMKKPSTKFQPLVLPNTCLIQQKQKSGLNVTKPLMKKTKCSFTWNKAVTKKSAEKLGSIREVNRSNREAKVPRSPCQKYAAVSKTFSKEVEMRDNAELQAIKIYDEMKSAWAKIAKLEKEVKHLHKKRNSTEVLEMFKKETKNHATENFQLCLTGFQDVLKELRCLSNFWEMEHNSIHEVHTRICDKSLNISAENYVKKVECQQFLTEFSLAQSGECECSEISETRKKYVQQIKTMVGDNDGAINGSVGEPPSSKAINADNEKKWRGNVEDHIANRPRGNMQCSHQTLEGKDKKAEERKSTSCESLRTNSKAHAYISEMKGMAKDQSSIVSSEASTIHAPSRDESDSRVNSLKDLRSNLEELLEKINTKMETCVVEDSKSQLTISENDSQFSLSNRSVSRYSMDFDSLSVSAHLSLNNLAEVYSNRQTKESYDKLARNNLVSTTFYHKNNTSCSSSLNLSSIVDLLGNFSVADIGSSTLTPP